MKKAFIKAIIIILIFLGFIVSTVTLAYAYISDKVLTENIGDNLTSILNTTTDSFTNHLETDYKFIKSKIDSLTEKEPSLTLDEKLIKLNEEKEQILLFDNLHGGFGGFVEKENRFLYYIDGLYYQDVNATYSDLDSADDFIIFNFGNPDYVRVDDDLPSAFSDKPYIILKFNEIIVYLDANQYFDYIINQESLVEYKNIFILYPDGKITYQDKGTKHGPFYQMLSSEHNAAGIIDDIKLALNSSEKVSNVCISNVQYKGIKCYLLANNLSTESFDTKLCIVELVNYQKTTSPIEQALAPLIAAFVLIIVCVLILVTIFFFHFSRKSNDIDMMVYRRYNDPIFKMKVTRNGDILRMNKNMRNILNNYHEYKSINDFVFKEVYPDYVIAMMTQKPLTIKLSGTQVNGGDTVYLRCVVLRYFGDYVIAAINATSDEINNNRYLNLALYNSETSLPNDKLFIHDIGDYIYKINNKKNKGLISLALIKIRNFRNFLSFYGKIVSDGIILQAKEKLETHLDPRYMTLYYVDEAVFGLAVDALEDYEELKDFAKVILEEFKKPVEVNSNNLILDIGFAIYNLDLETYPQEDPELIYTSLLKLTEKIENSVSQRIETFSLAVERYMSSEEILEQDLRNAIKTGEFEMYLQPQYDCDEKRICGGELLIRWNNPKYYHQSPAHFIEMAERNGLIIDLSKFIIDQAMLITKKLEQYNIEISINISPVQLLQAGFVNEFIEFAEKHQVNTANLALEITETFLMENFSIMNEKLKLLQKYGFKIHLDDFCTGYSSMLYLKELPINAIKIDKEFTKELNIDSYSRAIVNKLAALAKSLDLDIIAEGVEDEKQLAFLTKNGCNIIQGYLISKAVSINNAIQLIEGYNVTKTLEVGKDKKKK